MGEAAKNIEPFAPEGLLKPPPYDPYVEAGYERLGSIYSRLSNIAPKPPWERVRAQLRKQVDNAIRIITNPVSLFVESDGDTPVWVIGDSPLKILKSTLEKDYDQAVALCNDNGLSIIQEKELDYIEQLFQQNSALRRGVGNHSFWYSSKEKGVHYATWNADNNCMVRRTSSDEKFKFVTLGALPVLKIPIPKS